MTGLTIGIGILILIILALWLLYRSSMNDPYDGPWQAPITPESPRPED